MAPSSRERTSGRERPSRRQFLQFAAAGMTAYGGIRGIGTVRADFEVEWTYPIGGTSLASPTVVDDTVYIGSQSGAIYAIDATYGEERWSLEVGDSTTPTVTGGAVFFGSEDGNVRAVDAADGDERWSFPTDGQVVSSPTVADGAVFVGSNDAGIYSIDAETGDHRWTYETGQQVRSSPTVVDGMVFVGSDDGQLYALDAVTGERAWSFGAGDLVLSSPTEADGTIFVGGADNNLYALDAESGEERWSFETGWWIASSPTELDGTVYVGGMDSYLYALDAETGEQEWSFATSDWIGSSPTVVGGVVFVGGGDGQLYAVDAATGDHRWFYSLENPLESSPTVVDRTLYFGGTELYALSTEVPGSSEGSRVRLGTLGHHHDVATRVTLGAPAAFDIAITDTNAPVEAGDDLTVTIEVTNTGEVTGSATVEIDVESLGTETTEPDQLAGGESVTISVSFGTSTDDDGTYTITARTADGSDSREITVESPESTGGDTDSTGGGSSDGGGSTDDGGAAGDAESTDDGQTGGDGDGTDGTDALVGPTELAAVGGGGLLLLLGGYVYMRRRSEDDQPVAATSATDDSSSSGAGIGRTSGAGTGTSSGAVTGTSSGAGTGTTSGSSTGSDSAGSSTPTDGPAGGATGGAATGAGAGAAGSTESTAGAGEPGADKPAVDDVLSEMESLLTDARESRDAFDLEDALDSCDTAIEKGEPLRESATVKAPHRVSDIDEALEAAAALRDDVATELETYRDGWDRFQEMAETYEELAGTVDPADADDLLQKLGGLSRSLDRVEDSISAYEFETLAARIDTLRSECREFREYVESGTAAYEEASGELDAIAGELDEVSALLEGDDYGAAIQRLDDLEVSIDATAELVGGYRTPELDDRIDDQRDRWEELREEALAARGSMGGVPDEIPAAPQLSLDYSDIKRVDLIGKGGNADVYRAIVPMDDGEEIYVAVKEPRVGAALYEDTIQRGDDSTEFAAERETAVSDPDGAKTQIGRPEDEHVPGESGTRAWTREEEIDPERLPDDVEIAESSGLTDYRTKIEPGGGDGETAADTDLGSENGNQIVEEAEKWQKIDDHDHIVDVVDYDTDPGPWIAMEYMDGGHLGESAGEMELDRALWTAIATTEAVLHAHRRGLAHLDLKPENILFRSIDDAWDAPKVADWGLSKLLLNHSQSVAGLSAHYAAPEQFDRSFGEADDITDIYGLGAVFYRLFTGEKPFEGRPVQVMNQVVNNEIEPPSEVVDLPEALDDIILKAMAVEKDDRFEHVLYLRDDLQELRDSLSGD